MKILFYGAGAIGGYLATKLIHGGHDVSLIVREQTATLIRENGLGMTEAWTRTKLVPVRPQVFSSLDDALAKNPEYSLIAVGTKSYHLDTVIPDLQRMKTPIPAILTLQNGIGVEEKFTEAFPNSEILAGSVTMPVSRPRPNHVHLERKDGGIAFASTQQGKNITAWLRLFSDAKVNAINIPDYQSMKWSKALGNIMGNASSAILNMSPVEVYEHRGLFAMEIAMLKEALAVMGANGLRVVDLPIVKVTQLKTAVTRLPRFISQPLLIKEIAKGRGDKMPSFHIDLHNDNPLSEVIYHNGAIAAAGKKAGVKTPVNKMLNDTLLQLISGEQSRTLFDNDPDQLLNLLK